MNIRAWLANKLVALARKIDPPNKSATAFMMDTVMDAIINGTSAYKVVHVPQEEMYWDKTEGDA